MEAEQVIILFLIGTLTIMSFFVGFLSKSGSVAAFLLGAFTLIGFGLKGLFLMGIFFITSSLLSKYKQKQKEFLEELHEKGSARDWGQVAANGGTAALAALGNFFFPDPVWAFAFAISLATANADTWASELGVLSKKSPVSVRGFHRVPPGTSGAISGFGTLASTAGSFLIAIAASLLFYTNWMQTMTIVLLGMLGTMIDTFIGAYSQALYRCSVCGIQTEKALHCEKKAEMYSGRGWINNDAVNFLSGSFASLLGIVLYKLVFHS